MKPEIVSRFEIRNSRLSARGAERGVLLIELLVAMAIFISLMGMVGGLWVSLSRMQRGLMRDVRVVDNARFVLDTIARTLRTVSSDDMTPSGNVIIGDMPDEFLTIAHSGKTGGLDCWDPTKVPPCYITYRLDSASGQIFEQDGAAATTGTELPLTSSAVEVTDFKIFFSGREAGDNIQPRATIVIAVRDRTDPPGRPPLRAQTTISLRPLD